MLNGTASLRYELPLTQVPVGFFPDDWYLGNQYGTCCPSACQIPVLCEEGAVLCITSAKSKNYDITLGASRSFIGGFCSAINA